MEAERAREEERRRIEEEERMKLAVKESESQEAELIIVENLEQTEVEREPEISSDKKKKQQLAVSVCYSLCLTGAVDLIRFLSVILRFGLHWTWKSLKNMTYKVFSGRSLVWGK